MANSQVSSKNVLIIGKNPQGLLQYSGTLEKMGYSVKPITSNSEAKTELEKSNYSVIITESDDQDPATMEILSLFRSAHPKSHTIQISNTKNLAPSTQKNTTILSKPLLASQLVSCVKKAINDQRTKEDILSEFFPIPIRSFHSNLEMDSAVYIKLSNDHFVKLAHHFTEIDSDRLNQFEKNGAKEVWIEKVQVDPYLQTMMGLAVKAQPSAGGQPDRAMKLASKALESSYAALGGLGISNETLAGMRGMLDQLSKKMLTFPERCALFETLARHTPDMLADLSFSVLLTLGFAKSLGIKSDNIMSLGEAAYFRDLGLVSFPDSMRWTTLDQCPPQYIDAFQKHPIRTIRFSNESDIVINDTVKKLILEHHSYDDPKCLPITKILQTIDLFVITYHALISAMKNDVPTTKQVIHALRSNSLKSRCDLQLTLALERYLDAAATGSAEPEILSVLGGRTFD